MDYADAQEPTRLKDFRRIHTRYDKRADIFLSALFIVAAVIWWAN
ncbi:transposase [Sphingobium jiangsuense]|uniref:Transposase n=1 Tax=Sphingobium jiangsuense TaxID=870476 RepID=A0A7W6BKZ8_9SPHN|nr:transposase [Sphingobium jiangsuense]